MIPRITDPVNLTPTPAAVPAAPDASAPTPDPTVPAPAPDVTSPTVDPATPAPTGTERSLDDMLDELESRLDEQESTVADLLIRSITPIPMEREDVRLSETGDSTRPPDGPIHPHVSQPVVAAQPVQRSLITHPTSGFDANGDWHDGGNGRYAKPGWSTAKAAFLRLLHTDNADRRIETINGHPYYTRNTQQNTLQKLSNTTQHHQTTRKTGLPTVDQPHQPWHDIPDDPPPTIQHMVPNPTNVDRYSTWMTSEIDAELADARDSLTHTEQNLADARVALVAQTNRTAKVYGKDRSRWPADSEHAVRVLEDQIKGFQTATGGYQSTIRDLETARASKPDVYKANLTGDPESLVHKLLADSDVTPVQEDALADLRDWFAYGPEGDVTHEAAVAAADRLVTSLDTEAETEAQYRDGGNSQWVRARAEAARSIRDSLTVTDPNQSGLFDQPTVQDMAAPHGWTTVRDVTVRTPDGTVDVPAGTVLTEAGLEHQLGQDPNWISVNINGTVGEVHQDDVADTPTVQEMADMPRWDANSIRTGAVTHNKGFDIPADEIGAGTPIIDAVADTGTGGGWDMKVSATPGVLTVDGGFIAAADPVVWKGATPKYGADKQAEWWGRKLADGVPVRVRNAESNDSRLVETPGRAPTVQEMVANPDLADLPMLIAREEASIKWYNDHAPQPGVKRGFVDDHNQAVRDHQRNLDTYRAMLDAYKPIPAPDEHGRYPTVDRVTPDMVQWATEPDPDFPSDTVITTEIVGQFQHPNLPDSDHPFNATQITIYHDGEGSVTWSVDAANPETDWRDTEYATTAYGFAPGDPIPFTDGGRARTVEQAQTDALDAVNQMTTTSVFRPVDTTHSVGVTAALVADRNRRAPRLVPSTMSERMAGRPADRTGWDTTPVTVLNPAALGDAPTIQEMVQAPDEDAPTVYGGMRPSDLKLLDNDHTNSTVRILTPDALGNALTLAHTTLAGSPQGSLDAAQAQRVINRLERTVKNRGWEAHQGDNGWMVGPPSMFTPIETGSHHYPTPTPPAPTPQTDYSVPQVTDFKVDPAGVLLGRLTSYNYTTAPDQPIPESYTATVQVPGMIAPSRVRIRFMGDGYDRGGPNYTESYGGMGTRRAVASSFDRNQLGLFRLDGAARASALGTVTVDGPDAQLVSGALTVPVPDDIKGDPAKVAEWAASAIGDPTEAARRMRDWMPDVLMENRDTPHGVVLIRGTVARPVLDAANIRDAINKAEGGKGAKAWTGGRVGSETSSGLRFGRPGDIKVLVLDQAGHDDWQNYVDGTAADIARFKDVRKQWQAERKAAREARRAQLPDGNDRVAMAPVDRAKAAADGAWLVAGDNYLSRIGVQAGQAVQVRYVDDTTGEIQVVDGAGFRPQQVKWDRFSDAAPADAVKVEMPEAVGNQAVALKATAAASVAGRVRDAGVDGAPVEVADSYLKRYGINPGDVITVNWLDDKNAVFNADGRQIKAGWARFTNRVPEPDADGGWTLTDTPDEPTVQEMASSPGVEGTILRQIGSMTVMAISGGRRESIDRGVRLPVGAGYRVDVTLNPDDTYRVDRVFTRNGRDTVKGTVDGVYAEQLSDVAFAASTYTDPFGAPTIQEFAPDTAPEVKAAAATWLAHGWTPTSTGFASPDRTVTVTRVGDQWRAVANTPDNPFVAPGSSIDTGDPRSVVDFADHVRDLARVEPVDTAPLVSDRRLAELAADPDVTVYAAELLTGPTPTFGVVARSSDMVRVNETLADQPTRQQAAGAWQDLRRRFATLHTSDTGRAALADAYTAQPPTLTVDEPRPRRSVAADGEPVSFTSIELDDHGTPPVPGVAPIPDGMVRLYASTDMTALPAVLDTGLTPGQVGHTPDGAPNLVWASTWWPDTTGAPFVEFWVRPDELNTGDLRPGVDPAVAASAVDYLTEKNTAVVLDHRVAPDRIVSYHSPVTKTLRTIRDDPGYWNRDRLTSELAAMGDRDPDTAAAYRVRLGELPVPVDPRSFRPSNIVQGPAPTVQEFGFHRANPVDEAVSLLGSVPWPGPGQAPTRDDLAQMTPFEVRRLIDRLHRYQASHPYGYGPNDGVDMLNPVAAALGTGRGTPT